MIDRYLKDTNVTIHDDFKGTYSIPYKDNVEEIISLNNDIEILNNALKEAESPNFLYVFTEILKIQIFLYSFIFLSALGNFVGNTFFTNYMPFLGVLTSLSYAYKFKKDFNKRIEGKELQRNYILEEISKKKYQKQILERNQSKNNLIKEEVITLDTIAKKKAVLQNSLNLIMAYKMHQSYFRKNFDNHTLDNILNNEDDKRLIQEIIIKEIRR